MRSLHGNMHTSDILIADGAAMEVLRKACHLRSALLILFLRHLVGSFDSSYTLSS